MERVERHISQLEHIARSRKNAQATAQAKIAHVLATEHETRYLTLIETAKLYAWVLLGREAPELYTRLPKGWPALVVEALGGDPKIIFDPPPAEEEIFRIPPDTERMRLFREVFVEPVRKDHRGNVWHEFRELLKTPAQKAQDHSRNRALIRIRTVLRDHAKLTDEQYARLIMNDGKLKKRLFYRYPELDGLIQEALAGWQDLPQKERARLADELFVGGMDPAQRARITNRVRQLNGQSPPPVNRKGRSR